MKALLNWRYYVLMVVGMIAVIGTFSVPIDDQPLGAWLLALIIPKIIGFGAWYLIFRMCDYWDARGGRHMGVEERLERIERLLLLGSKEVLNTSEIALLLGISESRVRHLTSAKKIPHYKQGNKIYFRKKEIEAWQLQSRVPTDDEIRSRGTTYAVTHK